MPFTRSTDKQRARLGQTKLMPYRQMKIATYLLLAICAAVALLC